MQAPTSLHSSQQRRGSRVRPLFAPLMAALGTAASGPLWADPNPSDPNPYYVGASESYTHTSNVFGTSTNQSDNYFSTNLLGGFDQQLGRQRVHGTGNVSYNKYEGRSELNNTSYGLNTGLDWNTLYQLSGNLGLQANRSLANLTDNGTVPISTRNVITTEQANSSVRWGGASVLSIIGDYTYARVRYSAPQYLSSQSSSNSESLGVNYNVSPDIHAGIAYRISSSSSPHAVYLGGTITDSNSYTGNSNDGRNIDLTLDWQTSARTGVNSRLSFTRQSNSAASGLNFSGLTGSIAASYALTGKTGLTAMFNRDAGSNGSLFNSPVTIPVTGGTTPVTPITGLAENSQVTNSFQLGANYAATAKISTNASVQYRHSKLVNTFASSSAAASSSGNSSDDSKTASLGVSYAVARYWSANCNASRSLRSVSGPTLFTNADYSYGTNSYGCTVQVTLR